MDEVKKQLMTKLGTFSKELEKITQGKCPICSKKPGNFRDAISFAEFQISGICQNCQDEIFKEEKE